jgi:class 3 adenylate cyclase
MFTDIRSFTSLAESLDPVDTIDLLNSYYALMFEAIAGNGGTVNQMLGDGLMAIFGAPTAQQDHALRAVRAALEMIDLIEAFNQQQSLENKTQIKIGIGVSSGKMVAGYAGTQQRATYTCVGDTVNLAARIEDYTKQAGRPVLIDRFTRERLPDYFRAEDIGEITFKGKQQAVRVFAVSKI